MGKDGKNTIDRHPKKKAIISELLKGISGEKVAKKYGVTKTTIYRYRAAKLSEKLAEELVKKDATDQNHILNQLEQLISRSWKYAEAVDDELRDPTNPDKYYLGPRAHDVEVVYFTKGGKIQKKAKLQVLLNRIEKKGINVSSTEIKITDPRMLHIRNTEALTKSLTAIGKIVGLVKEIHIDVTNTEEWSTIKQGILQATAKYPEVREEIIANLKQIDNRS